MAKSEYWSALVAVAHTNTAIQSLIGSHLPAAYWARKCGSHALLCVIWAMMSTIFYTNTHLSAAHLYISKLWMHPQPENWTYCRAAFVFVEAQSERTSNQKEEDDWICEQDWLHSHPPTPCEAKHFRSASLSSWSLPNSRRISDCCLSQASRTESHWSTKISLQAEVFTFTLLNHDSIPSREVVGESVMNGSSESFGTRGLYTV